MQEVLNDEKKSIQKKIFWQELAFGSNSCRENFFALSPGLKQSTYDFFN
jgi:hypothetical protein